MLFHMELQDNALIGWVLPDNPSAIPRIKIFGRTGFLTELEANSLRTDLRDRNLHETGMAGFVIDSKSLPNLAQIIDQIEIRDSDTNVLIYRAFDPKAQIEQKLFRFELQAMPDTKTEELFAKRFNLYYGAAHRFPQDTMFGIINNPAAKSVYISGRLNFQQYEQLLRERQFKIVTLIRNPYEEMAERLLFARYASNPEIPAFIADYFYGLEPLKALVKDIKFDDIDTIKAAFNSMNEEQKAILSNPLVRALACTIDERPKGGHVEIALSKLSRMDLVGLRNRFADFKSILAEVFGVDILGTHELTTVSWVPRIVEHLTQIKQARTLISLDLDLYSFAEQAITEVIG